MGEMKHMTRSDEPCKMLDLDAEKRETGNVVPPCSSMCTVVTRLTKMERTDVHHWYCGPYAWNQVLALNLY